MQVIFKYKGITGFGRMYGYSLKYNHMITKSVRRRHKILMFWQKHGLSATKDAYGISRSTLYEWRRIYRTNSSDIQALDPKSQAPLRKRKRKVNSLIINEIKRLRLEVCPNMGKDKIKVFLDEFCRIKRLETISASTIGRIVKDKKIYHYKRRVYHNGTVKIIKRTSKKRKPKGFVTQQPGDLLELDTIVKFEWGIKRYVITAIDTYSRFTFAWVYKRANSQNSKDFIQKLITVCPFKIKAIQTDNGSEFHKYFKEYLEQENILHYWNYPGQPYKNGHIEKYNQTLQNEYINSHTLAMEEPTKFNHSLMNYLIWYNTKRPHWSLNLLSPIQYLIKQHRLSEMLGTEAKA
jgi:putative transposase